MHLRPTKYNFVELAPLWFGRYLNNDDAQLVSSRIFEGNVKVAILPGAASISRFIPSFLIRKDLRQQGWVSLEFGGLVM